MSSVNKAALLAQKDRELEKQLISISVNAQPKIKKEKPISIGTKPIYTRVLEGTPEYMAQKIQTDAMLDAQLEKISTNATRDVVSGPPKLVSSVTQEMIDEYKAESSKPLVIGGVAYKYHPVHSLAALNLDQFDPTPFHILTEAEKEKAYDDIAQLREDIAGFNEEINRYELGKEQAKDTYEALLSKTKTKEKGKVIKGYEQEVLKLDNSIKNSTVNISKAETGIRQIEQFIEDRENDQQLSDAEQYRLTSVNKQRLNDATDEFNNLNTGRLNMEQNTNETDAEYLKRLQDVGIKPASVEEVQAGSEIMNTIRAQKHMEELLSDKGRIGNVVKMMDDTERFEFNKRFPRIKKKYLEEFGFNNKQITDREIYDFIVVEIAKPAPPAPPAPPAAAAVAPPRATVAQPSTSVTDPLSAMLLKRQPPAADPSAVPWTGRAKKPLQAQAQAPSTPPPSTRPGMNLTLQEQILAAKLKPSKDRAPTKDVASAEKAPPKLSMMEEMKAKMTQRANTMKAVDPDDDDEWNPDEPIVVPIAAKKAPRKEAYVPAEATSPVKPLGPKEILVQDMRNAGLNPNASGKPKTSEQMIGELMAGDYGINIDALQRARIDSDLKTDALSYMAEKQKILSGVGIKKLPTSMPFGKVIINPDRLFYKNTLIIRRLKDKKSITGHKNIVVSDDFVDIIFKIIDGKAITKTNIKDLSNKEKILYDNLIMQSGLHKTQPHTIDDSSQQLKKRLELVVGEIEAGNSNISLLEELHSLLNKMAYLNILSVNQATKYYKSIKTQHYT